MLFIITPVFASTTISTNVATDGNVTAGGSVGINYGGTLDTTFEVGGTASISGIITLAGGQIRPSTNSTTALRLQNAAGTTLLNLDTTNSFVGIGTTAPLSALDVSGAVIAGLGTTSSPSYSFRGDQDSGIWSPTANTIALSVGGSEKWRVTSGGNVGIGVTAPLTRFDVWQSTASSSRLVVSSALNAALANAATVAYSRFGTSTTTRNLSAASDLLVSGKLEVVASSNFLSQIIVKNTTDTLNVASISAPSLTTGNLFNIQTPASSTFIGNVIKVRDTNGQVVFAVRASGSIQARAGVFDHGTTSSCTSGATPAGCIDYAESMPTSDSTINAGTVVAIDNSNGDSDFSLVKARVPYDNSILGVVSTTPAMLVTGFNVLSGANATRTIPGQVPVALAGRVPVKISYENGSIHKGDYLTASSTRPGYAMKATGSGRVVGIALQNASAASGKTTVLILINLTNVNH